jgi:regulator of sigma E protease
MDSFLALAQQFAENFVTYTVALVFCISFVVFIHEMGHLLTAKLFKVRVTKFSLGFGRELFGRTDKHNTRWSFSMLPLGGYVELFGYDSAPEPMLWDKEKQERRPFTEAERKEAFCFKPLWQRTLIVAMGPMANFILAVLILASLYFVSGQGSTRPIIYAVAEGTAADDAGLEPMDEILKLDGEEIVRFEDVWAKSWEPDTAMVFTIRRGDEVFDVPVISRRVSYHDGKGVYREHGRVGATNFPIVKLEQIISVEGETVEGQPDKARAELRKYMGAPFSIEIRFAEERQDHFKVYPVASMNEDWSDPESDGYEALKLTREQERFYIRHGLFDSFYYAGAQIYKFIDESIRFLRVAFFRDDGEQKVGGLVTMGKIAGKAVDSGWYTFFMLIAVLSVQIGFINLLPIPVLDGGYLVFFLYEAVMGRPLSARIQDYALSIGLVLLIGIMLFANIDDFIRMFF